MITTIDRTHATAVGHFELREPRMGQSSRMAISQGESCRPPSPSDTTTSSRFVSAVEEQIEHSKTHSSTLAEQSSSGLAIARSNGKSAKPKRVREPNWSEEEKHALLVLRLEALTRGPVIKCAGWSNGVSKNLLEKYGFDRNSKSCQQQWDTLLKDYKSIRKFHESTHSGISFWKMDEHQRSKSNEKFPRVFYKGWYVLMESIIEAEKAKSWSFVSAVEEQIEHSKTHWSTLAEQSSSGLGEGGEGDCEAEESNKQEIFRKLQRHSNWGGFFRTFYGEDENPFDYGELVVGEKFADHTTISSCFVSAVEEQIERSKAHWTTCSRTPEEDQLGERAQAFAETSKKIAAILSTGIHKCRRFLPGKTSVSMSEFPLPEFGAYEEQAATDDEKELLESLDFWIKRDGCSARQLKKARLEEEQINPFFPIWESVELMLQLAKGMKNMHPKEMIHRDLKPLNVLVKRVHNPELFYMVKMVDFGKSKASTHTVDFGQGTTRWMAPEVFKANADHKSPICGLPKLKNEAPNHSLFKTPDQGTRGWSVDEIRTMLELTEEALKVDRGPDIWDYVSENLWEHYGFDRASTSCENMWGILLQSYKETQASTEFELVYRNIIERILTRKLFDDGRNDAGFSLSAPASPLCPFQFRSPSDMVLSISRCCEEMLYDEATDEEMEEVDIHSEDEELSGDSTATFESQVEIAADSHFSRINEPDYETNSNNAGRKMSADTIMEDELISRIAPFVNKQIEDTLKPLLSVLRKREEDDQMHREKLLTIKEEKLALKREKISFAHRVLANF